LEAGDSPEQIVCDYLAAMTDRFAVAKYNELFVPKSWHG
jgi:dGTPase